MNSLWRNELDLSSLENLCISLPSPPPRLIIEHTTVYTGDSAGSVFEDATIVAENGIITMVSGATQTAAHQPPSLDHRHDDVRIDGTGYMVLPGFVDAHYHEVGPYRFLEHGRSPYGPGPYANRGFDHGGDLVRLTRDLGDRPNLAQTMEPEHLALGTLFGMWQQLRRGIVAFGEVGSIVPGNIVADVAMRVGLRARVGLWASDIAITPTGEFERIHDTEKLLSQLEDVARLISQHPKDFVGLYPSCMFITGSSDELLTGLRSIADAHDAPWATHLDCLPNECAVSKAKFGSSPIERAEQLGFLGDGLLGVHTAYFDDGDAKRLLDHGVRISHSPGKYMTSGENPAATGRLLDARDAGIEVSVSTDSEVFPLGGVVEAMRSTLTVHNQMCNSATALSTTEVLAMGTSLGASALRWSGATGTIAPGVGCDLVMVRTDDWRFAVTSRPLDTLLHLGSSADIDTVIVAGRVLVANGRALYVDEAALLERFHHSSMAVAASMSMPPAHWSTARLASFAKA